MIPLLCGLALMPIGGKVGRAVGTRIGAALDRAIAAEVAR